MMVTIPTPNYKTRLLVITSGIVILFWSGLEDNQVLGVALLGWGLALICLLMLITSRFGGQTFAIATLLKLSPLIGGLVGASASLLTVLLMLFKDVRHAHIFPDYPPELMLAMLERLPLWAIGGAFMGIGVAYVVYVLWSIKGTHQAESALK